jgi:hypothetical protein
VIYASLGIVGHVNQGECDGLDVKVWTRETRNVDRILVRKLSEGTT